MSAAEVTLRLRWDGEWPGDEHFDAWLYSEFGHCLEQLRLAAVDEVEVIGWGRLLEPGEPIE